MNYIILNPTDDDKSAIASGTARSAIAPKFDTAEEAAKTVLIAKDWEGIRVGLRDVAFEHASNIRQLAQAAVAQALQMGQRLWRMKVELHTKEYGVFLRVLGWTTTKACKYINLAKTFDGFEITQLTGIELTTLLGLCSRRYQEVVAQLKEIPDISQELVEKLMKQSRIPNKSKEEPISGWKQARSGGGRYYNVILHDERTGLLIEEQAQTEGVLPHKIITDAVVMRAQYKASGIQRSEYVLAQGNNTAPQVAVLEIKSENHQLTEVRANILPTIRTLRDEEAQVKTIDAQIQERTSKLALNNLGNQDEWNLRDPLTSLQKLRATKIAGMLNLAHKNAIPVIDDELQTKGRIIWEREYTVQLLLSAKTWEEVALIVGCERNNLLKAAKAWTLEERQFLVKLLTDYLRREPLGLNQVSWVSKNLLEKALSSLKPI